MIYFDNAASTPLTEEVRSAINNTDAFFGNASSRHHCGRDARFLIDSSRNKILNLLNASDGTVVFTSGGTESNNLAIIGVGDYLRKINRTTIITSKIEHSSVLNVCKHMESNGFNVIYMPVDCNGCVDIEELDNVMQKNRETIGLVTIQTANSEIGSAQNIEDIGFLCRENRALFHTDAVQAIGYRKIDVEKCNIDMLSISGHKIHAPKGVGALYVREKEYISPTLLGGGQEFGLRSGTENTAGIVGIGVAADFVMRNLDKNRGQVSIIRDALISKLESEMTIPYFINCLPDSCNIISLTIPKVEGSALSVLLDEENICVSTGSACNSGNYDPSYVLKSIGLSDSDSFCTIRISISHLNTLYEANVAAKKISEIAKKLYLIGAK